MVKSSAHHTGGFDNWGKSPKKQFSKIGDALVFEDVEEVVEPSSQVDELEEGELVLADSFSVEISNPAHSDGLNSDHEIGLPLVPVCGSNQYSAFEWWKLLVSNFLLS